MTPSITIKSSFTLFLLLLVFGSFKAHNSLAVDDSIYQFDNNNNSISNVEYLTYEDPNDKTSLNDSLDQFPIDDDDFGKRYF